MPFTIKNEAVYPPAIFSLTRMAHSGPNRGSAKGSYELYDTQQNAVDSFGEKKVNGITGTAPGSPGSIQDFKQLVMNLQRELEESKRKESELQQIIADLNNPQSNSDTSFADSQFLEGTASNDSVGENVKDAHIKHLQRQVTVLQATLYKSEGWAHRVASALKERDIAMDNVTQLMNEVKVLQGDKNQLQYKIEQYSTALKEMQQKLQQMTAEVQNQMYNGHLVSQLREEVQKQKLEITTLKESLTRLDLENRSLKDPSVDTSSQSLGNVACSQELEHLHKVVDTLKNTVLEQRSYLLNFRKPNSSSNAKSFPTSSVSVASGGTQDFSSTRSSVSLTPAGVSSAENNVVAVSTFVQQPRFAHPAQAAGVRPAAPREGVQETRRLLHSTGSAQVFNQMEAVDMRRKLNSQDIDDVFDLENLNSPNHLIALAEGLDLRSSDVSNLDSSSAPVAQAKQKSPENFKQQGHGDIMVKNGGQAVVKPPSAYVLNSAVPQHRTTQSEVLAHRNGLGKVNLHQGGAKSETIGRQGRPWNGASTNSSSAGGDANKFVQASPGLALNQAQRYQSARPIHQEPVNSAPMIFDGKMAPQFENVNLNSPASHLQQIYHPPANYQEGLPHMHNRNATPEVHVTASAPAPAPHRAASKVPGQEVFYVNTAAGIGGTLPTDTDPSRARLNSDKLCPVCNNDFSHVSMEEFQTHVFECFDDEAAPETMKPQTCVDRTCPMCDMRFGASTSQVEFEKHVHDHFDGFEELVP